MAEPGPAFPRRGLFSRQYSKAGIAAANVALDLNGTLPELGIMADLVGTDGEMRVQRLQPGGQGWTVAAEAPHTDRRAGLSCCHRAKLCRSRRLSDRTDGSWPDKGTEHAKKHGLDALLLLRNDHGDVRGMGIGQLFAKDPTPFAPTRGN